MPLFFESKAICSFAYGFFFYTLFSVRGCIFIYAVFSAVGTICTALMDTLLFQVEFSMAKGLFIALLILGVISLKLAENGVSGTEKE